MATTKRTFTYHELNSNVVLEDSCDPVDLTNHSLTCVVGPVGLNPDQSMSHSGICLNRGGTLMGGGGSLIGRRANVRFPCKTGKWSVTFGSPYHKVRGGVGGADDTFAIDLNLNKPEYNSDKGKAVYAVEDGRVEYTKSSSGFVLIRHDSMLVTDDKENISPWYSGYLHMSGITTTGEISKGSIVGYISDKGMTGGKVAANAHLHFALYRGYYGSPGDLSELQSIDIKDRISSISSGIDAWFYSKRENSKKVYNSKFIKDLNYPDNDSVKADIVIEKQWEVQNIGEAVWQLVVALPKNPLAKRLTIATPQTRNIEPGVKAKFKVSIRTPKEPGVYKLEYILSCPEGDFGGVFYTLFKVPK